jgi:hypothetical protein
MMIRYALLLLVALMLGGCCLSGDCYAPLAGPAGVTRAPTTGTAAMPTASVAPAAPDGLGSGPSDGSRAGVPAKPKRTAQRRTDFDSIGDASSASRYPGGSWEEQQATDRADEEQLKRKLIICQNCSTSAN